MQLFTLTLLSCLLAVQASAVEEVFASNGVVPDVISEAPSQLLKVGHKQSKDVYNKNNVFRFGNIRIFKLVFRLKLKKHTFIFIYSFRCQFKGN